MSLSQYHVLLHERNTLCIMAQTRPLVMFSSNNNISIYCNNCSITSHVLRHYEYNSQAKRTPFAHVAAVSIASVASAAAAALAAAVLAVVAAAATEDKCSPFAFLGSPDAKWGGRGTRTPEILGINLRIPQPKSYKQIQTRPTVHGIR